MSKTGITKEEREKLQSLIDRVESVGGNDLIRAEESIHRFFNQLLAPKDKTIMEQEAQIKKLTLENETLKARQITPAMWTLLDEAKEAGKQGNGGREFFALKEFLALIEALREGDPK
jgi:hypothetical protein